MENEIEGVEEILPERDPFRVHRSQKDARDRRNRRQHVRQKHHQEEEMLVVEFVPYSPRRHVLPMFRQQTIGKAEQGQEEGTDFKTDVIHVPRTNIRPRDGNCILK